MGAGLVSVPVVRFFWAQLSELSWMNVTIDIEKLNRNRIPLSSPLLGVFGKAHTHSSSHCQRGTFVPLAMCFLLCNRSWSVSERIFLALIKFQPSNCFVCWVFRKKIWNDRYNATNFTFVVCSNIFFRLIQLYRVSSADTYELTPSHHRISPNMRS